MTCIAAILIYITAGVFFVFVGPAAQSRRIETAMARASARKAWQPRAFSALLGTGIVLLWPFFVPSAWKSNRVNFSHKQTMFTSAMPPPSNAVTASIQEAKRQGPSILSFDEFREIGKGLGTLGQLALLEEIENLGYTVNGATTEAGISMSVVPSVMREIGSPIVLRKSDRKLENAPKDEEVWYFTTDRQHWSNLAGRAGLAFVRDRTVVKIIINVMS
ncbi:hypothetical protein [Mesorhizobium sp. URHB0026]